MKTKNVALGGLMLAMIVVLSIIESFFPPMPFLPPGVKLGLSNIVVMYSVFFLSKKYAVCLAIFKSIFVFLTRGFLASLFSFSGGLLSIVVIVLFVSIFKDKISYITLSILGAISHNIGQIIVFSFVMKNVYVMFSYTPILIISGIIMGTVTGILLKAIMPVFKKMF